MTTCPQCGTQNLPGMAYCEHCGSPLAAPVQEAAPVTTGADPSAAAAIAQAQSMLNQIDADSGKSAGAAAAQAPAPAAPVDQAPPDAAPASAQPAASPTPAAPQAAPGLTITFTDGAQYTVSSDITNIGRSDVAQNWHPELDLIPFGGGAPDLGVSRHQALIQRSGSGYSLIDVGSTNGTFVNGKALEYNKPVELQDGDNIAFGAFNAKISIH